MKNSYRFKSNQFEIELGEDAETNPRRYGRQLANWLKGQFEILGYNVEEVILEDWGWCVMCQRQPFSLWIGCGNEDDSSSSTESDPPPKGSEVTWECFAVAEAPFLRRLFGKVDTSSAMKKIDSELKRVLTSYPSNRFVDES